MAKANPFWVDCGHFMAGINELCLSLENRNNENNMLHNLDELIELNLKLLNNAPNMYMWRIDFRNEKGQKIKDSLRFAKILDKKGLIDLEPGKEFRCELTKLGRDIFIGVGWIKYSEMEKENNIKESNKTSTTIITENYIGGDNHGTNLLLIILKT